MQPINRPNQQNITINIGRKNQIKIQLPNNSTGSNNIYINTANRRRLCKKNKSSNKQKKEDKVNKEK